MSTYAEQRYRRAWWPDEQVQPVRVLEVLTVRRKTAREYATVVPWMSMADIGIALGLVVCRWASQAVHATPLLQPDPTTCHRSMPRPLRWRHPVAQRDVRAALNHYQAEGTILRLPHPLATWGVYVWPLDAADGLSLVSAWQDIDADREAARHAQRVYRLSIARRAAGLP